MAAGSEFLLYARMARLSWRNVVRNWRHGLATIAAIAIGFMAISLFDGFILELVERMQDGYINKGMLGHVVIQHEATGGLMLEDSWRDAMTAEEQRFLEDFLAKDPAFSRRVRFLSLAGLVNSGENSAVFMGYGYDIDEGSEMRGVRWEWDTAAGKPIHLAKGHAVLLGGGLAEILGCVSTYAGPSYVLPDGNFVAEERPFRCEHPRVMLSATTEASQINAVSLEVTGIFDAGFREANKRAVHMGLEDAQRLLDTDKITMVGVRLTDDSEAADFISRFKTAGKAAHFELDAVPWVEHRLASVARGGLEILGVFRILFMFIVIVISVMAVANTMMKSVNERIREIGTFRSLGYLRHHIMFMFACEGFFVSSLACSAGLLMTLAASRLVGALGIRYKAGMLSLPIELRIVDTPTAWVWSASLLSLLAMATAWFCARRAARMVVAHAIHHV